MSNECESWVTHPLKGERVNFWFRLIDRKLVNDGCTVNWEARITHQDGTETLIGCPGSRQSEAAMNWNLQILAGELVKDALR